MQEHQYSRLAELYTIKLGCKIDLNLALESKGRLDVQKYAKRVNLIAKEIDEIWETVGRERAYGE
jgi:hypothetical protein